MFYRPFEWWMGQSCSNSPSGLLGLCFPGMVSSPWHVDAGTRTSVPDVSRCLLRLVMGSSNQNIPHRVVPGEAPNPLTCDMTVSNTITTLGDHRGARSGGCFSGTENCTSQEGQLWTLEGTKSQPCPEVGCTFPQGCLSSLFSSELSQDCKSESRLDTSARGLGGAAVPRPLSLSQAPLLAQGLSLRNQPRVHSLEGRRMCSKEIVA